MTENNQEKIRNFCIIAHIDHGKSTLADRMLEITGTIEKRLMKEQLLDQMDLERERGITIKLAPVRMLWGTRQRSKVESEKPEIRDSSSISESGQDYVLNLIDTPGHVDFQYEVSRSLAAVEGAILLVDASQGVEAQTLSVLYSAIENNLTIIPVLNKIDLPAARPDEVADEIVKILGCKKEEILHASGKTGEGVVEILDAVVDRIPAPKGDSDAPLKALIFDSVFDPYRGVVSFVRIVDGHFEKNKKFFLMQSRSDGEAIEVGYFHPKYFPHTPLLCGEIGYIITGFKSVAEAQVGDTITAKEKPAETPLPGYKIILPSVFASIYCTDGDDYPNLKEAIEKLKLNDASLSYEAERSDALGFGFRCGFLGLLHMDIVRERLEREYNLSLVISSPSVRYRIILNNGEEEEIEKPGDLPEHGLFREVLEPWVSLDIFTPKDYVGACMDVVQKKRAQFNNIEYLDEVRAIIRYEMPLAEVIIDLYDQLKSVSKGYASMNYEMIDYRASDLEKVDILINLDKVDALSFITHKSKTMNEGRRITERLKDLIPRQNFEIKIQAAIGAKVVASERISPFRKDVTVGLYGGDVTRKNKLLDKQKKGKKKMKSIGRVEVPSDVFIKVLRNE
ncbi:MAG: translation elongation factor 4 [Candidatus Berkelbacteria bacterium]|nr:translation elongation factor 4 [Candidatus Berkelbacteria bacterium]